MSTRKRGRPGTGVNPAVGVRLPPKLLQLLDRWRSFQADFPGRPEAIRRLIEKCLGIAASLNNGNYDVVKIHPKPYIENVYTGSPILSPAQCRAARALLNWSQEELVLKSKITKKTVADFERGATSPRPQTLAQIIAAFEAAGIEFVYGGSPGARIAGTAGRR